MYCVLTKYGALNRTEHETQEEGEDEPENIKPPEYLLHVYT